MVRLVSVIKEVFDTMRTHGMEYFKTREDLRGTYSNCRLHKVPSDTQFCIFVTTRHGAS